MLKSAVDYYSHWEYRVEAKRILRTLDGASCRADPIVRKSANEYARDVLGHAKYAPWLYVYSAVAGTFKEGWIPDNYYGHVVVPRLKGRYGEMSSLNSLTQSLFESDAFPDLAYFVNGLFLAIDSTPISDRDVEALLFRDSENVVFKVDNSKQGAGVFFFDRNTFRIQKIKELGNGVFQPFLEQHGVFSKFCKRSVATLRMTTVVDDQGSMSLRACYLRLGRQEDTHVQSGSHIRIPVDLESGEFYPQGYLPSWLPIAKHPDTGVRFSGWVVPAYEECVATVLALHRKVVFARCVGWDVAIEVGGRVRLLEWNAGHNDIKFSEATQGPCFRDLRWEELSRDRRTTGSPRI